MTEFERGFTEELEKIALRSLLSKSKGAVGKRLGKLMSAAQAKDLPERGIAEIVHKVQKIIPDAPKMSKADIIKSLKESTKKTAAKTQAMGSTIPKPKTMESLMGQPGVKGYKGLASAIRSPLSLTTVTKPPKQTFFTGQ